MAKPCVCPYIMTRIDKMMHRAIICFYNWSNLGPKFEKSDTFWHNIYPENFYPYIIGCLKLNA